jgi:phosphoribosylglycinamide formyltransferase-1
MTDHHGPGTPPSGSSRAPASPAQPDRGEARKGGEASFRGNLRVGVLASGRGTNLQAIIDAIERGELRATLAAVVSDREGAAALERARRHGAPAVFLNPKDHGDRAAYDEALLRLLEAHGVELVCLAGFMRILGRAFVRSLAGRVMNIHPSLLPAFPGLAAQRQALDYGVKVAGATVHFVDEGVDTGPIIGQDAVPVLPDDTEDTLSARILEAEHRLYPRAIRLFAEGRLGIAGRRVIVDEPDHRGPAPR